MTTLNPVICPVGNAYRALRECLEIESSGRVAPSQRF